MKVPIQIVCFKSLEDLEKYDLKSECFFIDEMILEEKNTTPKNFRIFENNKILWMAILHVKGLVTDYFKHSHLDWRTFQLDQCLRTTPNISEKVAKSTESPYFDTKNAFNNMLHIPPHLPLGPKPVEISRNVDESNEDLIK